MDPKSLEASLASLCLDEELSRVVATKLGAIPKMMPPSAASDVATSPPPQLLPPAMATPARLAPPTTPAVLRRQQKKKNRKDRRRNDVEDAGTESPVTSRVDRSLQKSRSDVAIINSRLPVATASEDVTELFFKSRSSISLNTGVRNLPDSFFSDELPEEAEDTHKRDFNKRRRKGKKRKEEEKKESDKENEKEEMVVAQGEGEEEEGEGEQIITSVGDEQTVYNWRNVTKNGDIKKCILVDGQKDGGRPVQGDVVLVKSQGKLKDGTMIDDYPTLVFRVGEYEVIEGLDLVVQSMYKNELSIISIKPSLAYGEVGRRPDVPPNSRITYLFGLLHFEKQKEMSEMTWAQRRKMGQSRMRIANWWYSRKEYPVAVKCYKKALQFYNNIPTNQECSTPEEYRELLTLMEERLRVMRQVANIFKRIANLIQGGHIET